MRSWSISPGAYRRITGFALAAQVFIIVTGGAVRLTGSGLGCSDWPTCEQDRLVAPLEYHALVEFTNRTITGLVSIAVIAAVLGSLLRRPHRTDLVWWSFGLVAGVVGQIVLGGLTVLFHLAPGLVMAHFLVSAALVWVAVVLHHKAGEYSADTDHAGLSRVPPEVRLMARLLVAVAAVVLFTGTVVTGSGPHGGDESVERLPFFVPEVARIHGIAVALFVAMVLATWWMLRVADGPRQLRHAVAAIFVALVAQATIGYVQYFNDVPVLLVGLHLLGATVVWALVVRLPLLLGPTRSPAAAPERELVAP